MSEGENAIIQVKVDKEKDTMNTTHAHKKLVPLVTLSCMLLFAVKGDTEVVYENDFSTRTSANAIPTSG